MIVRYQLDNTESGQADYTGLSFMELYRLCRFSSHMCMYMKLMAASAILKTSLMMKHNHRADFLVASDLALRAQLTEFRDHQLVNYSRNEKRNEKLNSLAFLTL